jgi:DNA polymerase-1
MIMQVHDELVLEVPDSELKDVPEVIASLMSGVAELRVPLRVDVGSGANWAEAHS